MTNALEGNVIFSRDDNYAYRLRNKLASVGIKVQYVTETESLLYFMLQYSKGLIFIDSKITNFMGLVNGFSHVRTISNFGFIYLSDGDKCNITCDERLSFVAKLDDILPIVAKASQEMNKRHDALSQIPERFMDKTLMELLQDLNISTKYLGYHFIKDATKLLLSSKDKDYKALKDVYDTLARSANTTAANIEKAIRLAISKAENTQSFHETFKGYKVSNSVLLKYLAEKTKNNYFKSLEDNKII